MAEWRNHVSKKTEYSGKKILRPVQSYIAYFMKTRRRRRRIII
jgi:hypothetical protein